jgi:hypothetical protein
MVFLGLLIGGILLWTIISGIMSINYAWKECVADGDASRFMSYVFSTISGNWIAIIGILILCLPVWLILSLVIGGGKKEYQQQDSQYSHDQDSQYGTVRNPENLPETVVSQHTGRGAPKQITVGRSSVCNIKVDDKYADVSREHAVITISNNALLMEDKSSFGTYVNGKKMHNAKFHIYQGDHIRLGYRYMLPWSDINRFFPEGNSAKTRLIHREDNL